MHGISTHGLQCSALTPVHDEPVCSRRLEQLLNAQSSSIIDMRQIRGTLHPQTVKHISQRSTVARLVRVLQALECRHQRCSCVAAISISRGKGGLQLR